MGIDTNYMLKKQPFNISWKRFGEHRNVTVSPNRVFSPDTKFFAIGSCFANELRASLERRGIDAYPKASPQVHPLFADESKKPSSWGRWDDRVHLQFYNTASLRQEFEKAFGLWTQADDDYFHVTHGGVNQYWDPYRRAIYTHSPEDFAEVLHAQDAAMKHGIMTADAAIITLGLVEVFRRKDNGRVTCQHNRFFASHVQYETLDFRQNYENVKTICDLYFARFPNRKLVITVSPIALTQTFRELDVVVANSESKSILRAVAGQIAREYPNVIYWPSYEICMYNEGSFKEDLRHVTQPRIDSIMGAFIHTHIEPRQPVESEEALRYYP